MKKIELRIEDYIELGMSLNDIISEYVEDINSMSLNEVMYNYNVDSKEEAIEGVIEYWTSEFNHFKNK